MEQSKISVSIAIITCLRPKSLDRLLTCIKKQQVNQSVTVRLIIVDNDNTGHNETVVRNLSEDFPFEICLLHEPIRGIPQARNRAVKEAWNDDALIFIDDDETPSDNWLQSILDTWIKTQSDIITGPVKAILPENSPNWAVKSDTYSDIRKHVTGEEIKKAYTNNTLISSKVYHSIAPAFDPFFRFTGSEDIHFFQRATQLGFKIVWCEEALVYEIVPKSRVNIAWLVKRSFRNGSGDAMSRIRNSSNLTIYCYVFLMGCSRCFYGLLFLFKGCLTLDWKSFIRGNRILVSGIGTFMGLLGINYKEYKVIHGE